MNKKLKKTVWKKKTECLNGNIIGTHKIIKCKNVANMVLCNESWNP